jgi:hypothetical protein
LENLKNEISKNTKIIFLTFYMRQFFSNLTKYIVEGLVVAIVAFYIPQRNTDLKTVSMIGLIAALTFALLDYFSPSIGASSRLGAGFGIGSNLVGFGQPMFKGQGATTTIPTTSLPTVTEPFYSSAQSFPQYIAVDTVQPVAGQDALGNQVIVQAPTTFTTTTPNGSPDAFFTNHYDTSYTANPHTGYAQPTSSTSLQDIAAEIQ